MNSLLRIFSNRKLELNEEIESHLQMAIQDRIDRGESPQSAKESALREFGNVALVKDVTRETLSFPPQDRNRSAPSDAWKHSRTRSCSATYRLGSCPSA
jgi:hypothetical protein